MVLYRVNADCAHNDVDEALTGITREYFIAAVEEEWNFGPSGVNGLDLKPLTDPDRYR